MATIKLEEWFVSTAEYAKIKGITEQAIRKAIKEGRLDASKVGKRWVLPMPNNVSSSLTTKQPETSNE